MNIFITNYLSEPNESIVTLSAHYDLPMAKQNIAHFAKPMLPSVSPKDRAFNYGDGCFTTMYAKDARVFLFNQHIQRLARDAELISIELCVEALTQWLVLALGQLLAQTYQACAIKVVISRGEGGRGYDIPQAPSPLVLVSILPILDIKLLENQGEYYRFCVKPAVMQLSSQALLGGMKHLNRLDQILAKRELQQANCDDLLLSDQSGNLIEATAANIFFRVNQIWYTPEISSSGVSGVMRSAILEFMNKNGLVCKVKACLVTELSNADAVFLCNAIRFVIPVSHIQINKQTYDYNVSSPAKLRHDVYKWISFAHSLNLKGGE